MAIIGLDDNYRSNRRLIEKLEAAMRESVPPFTITYSNNPEDNNIVVTVGTDLTQVSEGMKLAPTNACDFMIEVGLRAMNDYYELNPNAPPERGIAVAWSAMMNCFILSKMMGGTRFAPNKKNPPVTAG